MFSHLSLSLAYCPSSLLGFRFLTCKFLMDFIQILCTYVYQGISSILSAGHTISCKLSPTSCKLTPEKIAFDISCKSHEMSRLISGGEGNEETSSSFCHLLTLHKEC